MASMTTKTSILDIDPGLPVSNPTIPFWQIPLHPLANVASQNLPTITDVVIIGSGISGCSVAKGILEGHESLNVTVLEARGLASGASSRNGGHIVSPVFQYFPDLIKEFGTEVAVRVAEFTLQNIERTFEAVDQFGETNLKAYSEIRRTKKVLLYRDQETFQAHKEILKVWNREMPESRRDEVVMITAEEAQEKFGLRDIAGAAIHDAAAVWPYRLWSGLWEVLSLRYKDRLAIETFTPVVSVKQLAVSDEGSPHYAVTTPRGEIHASHVIYCTNGFTSHLLPALRGKLFPLRGTMSTQDLGSSFPNYGATRSWSIFEQSKVDQESGTGNAGLYYLTQNPVSGYMFLGGEHDNPTKLITSDDSMLNTTSAKKIVEVLPRIFSGVESTPEVKSIWSGIMGFTRDGLPLAGRLPEPMTGRSEGGEWICAGFNGYGTGYCFSCGLAVAHMILGKDISSWFPPVFLPTKDRLEASLTNSKMWDSFIPL